MASAKICTCKHSEYSHDMAYKWCSQPSCPCKLFVDNTVMPQPAPERGAEDVNEWLISFITQRGEFGKSKYGVSLETHNGRDPYIDALQELGDAAAYISQWIMELKDEGRETFLLEEMLEYNIFLIKKLRRMHERGFAISSDGASGATFPRPRSVEPDYTYQDDGIEYC